MNDQPENPESTGETIVIPRIHVPAAESDAAAPDNAARNAPDRTVRIRPNAGSTPNGNGPSLLDQYVIVRKIGDGGMGIVYLGRDRKLGRHVAVKRLSVASLRQPALKQRFLREARAVAALNHIHIVHVYAMGEDEDGPYIVMEYVPGPPVPGATTRPTEPLTLGDLVARDGPLALGPAVDLILKLCRAVDYAHGCGVIHRDLKPTNVLIDESGEPKIVDFGLARHLGQATGPITVPGEKMLSIGYGAPEQETDASDTDQRADVYGLGAVFYFSITGQNPRYFRETDVPDSVRMAIVKALKTERAKRWPSVKDFAAAIASVNTPAVNPVPTAKTTWRCKWCDTINPVTLQFCGECGWDGRESCPECGCETREGIQYCGSCGADGRQYQSAIRLLERARRHWRNREYERIDQTATAIAAFTPIGPNGRAIVKEARDLVLKARQTIERRTQLRPLIAQELSAENYERAAKYIEEYRQVAGDGQFEAEAARIPDQVADRDLRRAWRAVRERDWITATRLVREQAGRVGADDARLRRVRRAIRVRHVQVIARDATILVGLLAMIYLYSSIPVFVLAGKPAQGAYHRFYAPIRYLHAYSPLRGALDEYAKLWNVFPLYAGAETAARPSPRPNLEPRPDPNVLRDIADSDDRYRRELDAADSEYRRLVADWPEHCYEQLIALRDEMQTLGDFDGWSAVQDSIDRLAATRAIVADADSLAAMPETLRNIHRRLAGLRDSYSAERYRKILSTAERHIKALTEWQTRMTKEGRIPDARLINQEIKRVRSGREVLEAETYLRSIAQDLALPPDKPH